MKSNTKRNKKDIISQVTKWLYAMMFTAFVIIWIGVVIDKFDANQALQLSTSLLAIGVVLLCVSYVLWVYNEEA